MTLFDPPFQRHSETSRAAAESIRPAMLSAQSRVLAYIAEHGPCTDEEIADGLSMNPSTERPRRIELLNAGDIREHPERRTTRSGRSAVAWIVSPWRRVTTDTPPL